MPVTWPFTSAPAFTWNQGPGLLVPTALTSYTTSSILLVGIRVSNISAAGAQFTMTDKNDKVIYQALDISPNGSFLEFPLELLEGIKWRANVLNALSVHMWGYI